MGSDTVGGLRAAHQIVPPSTAAITDARMMMRRFLMLGSMLNPAG